MATMPIYGKKPLKIFFSETSSQMTFELDIQHQGLGALQSLFRDDPGLTLILTYFAATLVLLYGKMLKYQIL